MTSSTAETTPVEAAVDHVLDGLDDHLDIIRGLTEKTDADFIDNTGNFNSVLRGNNDNAVRDAIVDFNGEVRRRLPAGGEVEGQSTLTDTNQVAIGWFAASNVVLPDWSPQPIRGRGRAPFPQLPDTVAGSRQGFLDTVEKVDEIVEWWSTDEPFFVTEGVFGGGRSEHGAVVYPAQGSDNIATRVSTTAWRNGSISAVFNGGTRVTVKLDASAPVWIDTEEIDRELRVPLLGYDADRHASPDDFQGPQYDTYSFLGPEAVGLKTDTGHFATRVALQMIGESAEGIQVPPPSDKFKAGILDLLAKSTIDAFNMGNAGLTAEVKKRSSGRGVRHVESVRVGRTPNLIRSLTDVELMRYLHGAGVSVEHLHATTTIKLAEMKSARSLADRIDGGVVEASAVDEFFDGLSASDA